MNLKTGISGWLAAVAVAAAPWTVSAATLTLSDTSSNPNISADRLDALMTFTVSGNQLTLNVTNNAEGFVIHRILFNGTPDVSSLTLVSADGWRRTGPRRATARRYGRFDYQFIAQGRRNPGLIEFGETQTFVFEISGLNLDDTDFTTDGTLARAPDLSALAGAQFLGLNGRGAFGLVLAGNAQEPPRDGGDPQGPPGAAVPLPASALMGLALLGGFGLNRRRLGLGC